MWTLLTILFVIARGTMSVSQLYKSEKSVELINGTYGGLTFRSYKTFVNTKSNMERRRVCLKRTCARKCCPFGMMYKFDSRRCVKETIQFDPPVLEEINQEFKFKEGFNAKKEFFFIIGKMACVRDVGERRLPIYPATDTFNLTTDGKLYVSIPSNIPNRLIYGPDKYCVDTFVSNKLEPHFNALICFVSEPQRKSYGLSSSCILISCFFILLTVAVYAWLPDLRNLHGMVLMTYLLCFFVGFLLLATMQVLIQQKTITIDVCTVLTFIIYFSLLSAFFWLNVMCYDIWWTFSGKRGHGRSGPQMKRFMYYAIYAFGVPTALTILLGALEFSDLSIQHPLLPKLRQQGCFLYGNSKLFYLYGPILLLCAVNMTFFGMTAFKIWKIKKETKVLRGNESSTHDQDRKETQRFTLYVKLFTVMGTNWILDPPGFLASSFYTDADIFWQLSDAYNGLVGLIIFTIFVCKKKTWIMIKKRIKDFQRTDSNSREININNVSNKKISRWKTNQDRNGNLETVKPTVRVEGDCRISKYNQVTPL